jgi:hypothetical protein
MVSRRSALRPLLALAAIAACGISPVGHPVGTADPAILGERPSGLPASLGPMPNRAAIGRMLWVPDIDIGFDPQGLALMRGAIYVSGYVSDSFARHRGRCRIYRLDPNTGSVTGHLRLPVPCGHAGGLAALGDVLYAADTHSLFAIAPDSLEAERLRVYPLGDGVKGAFAAADQGALWLGSYNETGQGRILRYDAPRLAALQDGTVLTPQMASAALPVPSFAQGAAIGPEGALWVARSDFAWGYLDRLDRATGKVIAHYKAPPGIEGIVPDGQGGLWAVSEAGARHPPFRYPFFPLIFHIDPRRLEADRLPDG